MRSIVNRWWMEPSHFLFSGQVQMLLYPPLYTCFRTNCSNSYIILFSCPQANIWIRLDKNKCSFLKSPNLDLFRLIDRCTLEYHVKIYAILYQLLESAPAYVRLLSLPVKDWDCSGFQPPVQFLFPAEDNISDLFPQTTAMANYSWNRFIYIYLYILFFRSKIILFTQWNKGALLSMACGR